MATTINRISSDAVKKATGMSWEKWIAVLDRAGAARMTHKDIVRLLKEQGMIDSPWWQQMVTVGYELAKGLRVVGETKDAGFEIGVSKTLPLTREQAWDLITRRPGRDAWLGPVPRLRFVKGEKYRTADGAAGEIRSVTPGKALRLTWQPAEWNHASTIGVHVVPSGPKASVRFHQEKLATAKERVRMRRQWKKALDTLEQLSARMRAPKGKAARQPRVSRTEKSGAMST